MTNRQAVWVAIGMGLGAAAWIVMVLIGVRYALNKPNPLAATMIGGALIAWVATKGLHIK
jgi:threonine/homoserine/homoserine lactone efflux protein